ncbi:hypothetical protein TSUD_99720 [Trifolium subterraneum]|uniref:Uncharacterized protein n=1 Tax=Trifolium subterraneum TaxID=3900 RepID=A0A2Z6PJP2_TRISU|nr:hypothetical protein TSUD_99720 [Trifolium subterraneum]
MVPAGKGKELLIGDAPSSMKKAVKHSGVGSSVARPPSSPLVEILPSTKQDGDVPVRTCIFPLMPLGGTRTEFEGLRKLLKETTLRE